MRHTVFTVDIGVLLKQAKYRYLAKAVCRLPRKRPHRGSRRCCAGPAAALRGSGCGSPPPALQTLTKVEALDISVADPDPESGAFLTPYIRDPGRQDPGSGPGTNNLDHISES
jgi:hypothetical protein